MKKHLRMFAVLGVCVLALGVWAAVYGQNNPDQNNEDNIPGSYLTTITDANTGAFASRSVITLHADHTLTVIDSNQEGSAFPPFSSQQGAWANSSGRVVARTINWSFPFATEGTARLDYNFTTVHTNQLSGTITLTFFPPSGNPLDDGGTEAGTFNFTGVRITVP